MDRPEGEEAPEGRGNKVLEDVATGDRRRICLGRGLKVRRLHSFFLLIYLSLELRRVERCEAVPSTPLSHDGVPSVSHYCSPGMSDEVFLLKQPMVLLVISSVRRERNMHALPCSPDRSFPCLPRIRSRDSPSEMGRVVFLLGMLVERGL